MRRPVLVTGANAGIGLATVRHLASLGFPVVAACHREDQVEDVRRQVPDGDVDVDVDVVALDVTDEAACAALVPSLDLWGLVNNAGYAESGALEDVPIAEAREQFETLVFAPVRMAQLALPAMRRRGEGRIVNVTSTVAHAVLPLLGWYCAAKHALAAASEALRVELAPAGIDVVAVEPGAFDTGIWDRVDAGLAARAPGSPRPGAYGRARSVVGALRSAMPGPDRVAATIGEALRSGHPRATYRVGWDSTALPLATRALPAGAKDRLLRTVLRL